jgi:hypothetical protein
MLLRLEELMNLIIAQGSLPDRRRFIAGSDARIIMSADEAALIRLWREASLIILPQNPVGHLRRRVAPKPKNACGPIGAGAAQNSPLRRRRRIGPSGTG